MPTTPKNTLTGAAVSLPL